ncbi:hypothetical protein GCM10009798_42090 [Nocardioides panacihumi]|uniref:DUF2530 domain-containing protein n=1 Tax=Nocardioides panacihumi TaxID=400774 RepID=A0ABN2RX98_9ACTN
MKSQVAREEQTLDIAAAVLVAAALWLLPVGAVLLGVALAHLDPRLHAVVGLAVYGYLPTVVVWLVVARRRRRVSRAD